ncbi:MAG: phosphate signaling complex protein PhoU [Clostridiaceae bacterium]
MVRAHFESSINELHSDIVRMGSKTERQIYSAMEALLKKDAELAQKIIDDDDIVDKMQKDIEDKSIKLIAMQQPLAVDLRDIFTVTKTVTDLERMADHAVDIAKIVKRLHNEEYVKELIDMPNLAAMVREMIKDSTDAFVTRDVEKAYAVCKKDNEVDALYKGIFKELLEMMVTHRDVTQQVAQLLFVCKYLERVADHCTNICESTIYIVTGKQIDLNE